MLASKGFETTVRVLMTTPTCYIESMVTTYMQRTSRVSHASPHSPAGSHNTPSLWAGTNGGCVFAYMLRLPAAERRADEPVTALPGEKPSLVFRVDCFLALCTLPLPSSPSFTFPLFYFQRRRFSSCTGPPWLASWCWTVTGLHSPSPWRWPMTWPARPTCRAHTILWSYLRSSLRSGLHTEIHTHTLIHKKHSLSPATFSSANPPPIC